MTIPAFVGVMEAARALGRVAEPHEALEPSPPRQPKIIPVTDPETVTDPEILLYAAYAEDPERLAAAPYIERASLRSGAV